MSDALGYRRVAGVLVRINLGQRNRVCDAPEFIDTFTELERQSVNWRWLAGWWVDADCAAQTASDRTDKTVMRVEQSKRPSSSKRDTGSESGMLWSQS